MIFSFAHASAELSIALDLGSVGQESSPVVMIGHDEKESTGQETRPTDRPFFLDNLLIGAHYQVFHWSAK
jgi:hypothetical protein